MEARSESENSEPYRRDLDVPSLTVATGGTLPFQVLADWRDETATH